MAIPAETLAALDAFATSLDTSIQDSTKTIPDYVAYYYFTQLLRGEVGSTTTSGTLTALTSASSSYTSVNGSSKRWTVPTGEKWTLHSVYAGLISSGTGGTRTVVVGHTSGGGTPVTYSIAVPQLGQIASLTYTYAFGIGQPDSSILRVSNIIPCPLPYMQLAAGDRLVVLDQSAIDTTNDALTVRAIVSVETV